MQEPSDTHPSKESTGESLRDSFRQSRKEFWFMIAAWIAFAAWTTIYNGLFANPGSEAPIELLFGFPRWVVIGVGLPWILSLGLTIWFAFCFMKDTDLDGEDTDQISRKEEG